MNEKVNERVSDSARYFTESLHGRDSVIASEIALELRRQQTQIELSLPRTSCRPP